MKLIIDHQIVLPTDDIDRSLLNEFNIMFQERGTETFLSPQKLCLGEVPMNSLFSECLSFGEGISIKYASIGGPGCEMALTLHQKLETSPEEL